MSMNTSEMTRTLEAAGIQEEQAKALADVIQKGREDLSTKADLEAATGKLGSAIVEVRTGLEGSMESIKGDIAKYGLAWIRKKEDILEFLLIIPISLIAGGLLFLLTRVVAKGVKATFT